MSEGALTCANHPNRATRLRCNRCEKPICTQCAVQTPVGYRCRECVRDQQSVFETAGTTRLLLAGLLSAVSVGLATTLLGFLGFWGLLLAPVAGGGIAEGIRRVIRGKWSRRLPLASSVGGALGVLVYLAVRILPYGFLFSAGFNLSLLSGLGYGLLWPVLQGGLIISALYARLKGIQL